MATFLTPHFTLEELIKSDTAVRFNLDNTPTPDVIENLKWLCVKILEPLRGKVGPILVSSGYRSLAVNTKVGGASNSAHILGQAADISVPNMTVEQLYQLIKTTALPFDQLIQEFNAWVHIQYKRDTQPPRLIPLRAVHGTQGTQYLPG